MVRMGTMHIEHPDVNVKFPWSLAIRIKLGVLFLDKAASGQRLLLPPKPAHGGVQMHAWREMAHQGYSHLHSALQEQEAPPKAICSPQRHVRCEMVDDARHDGGQQGCPLTGAQRDEQLRRCTQAAKDAQQVQLTICI